MRIKYILFILLINIYCIYFIDCSIIQSSFFSPDLSSKLIICQDDQLEGGFIGQPEELIGPYISCRNQAKIIVRSALLLPSNRDECPIQYVNTNVRSICEERLRPEEVDVTTLLKARCDHKEECFFSFETLFPEINCGFGNNQGRDPFVVPRDFQKIKLELSCVLKRPKFRPFANKRYDPKFLRTLGNPYRKLSFNHLRLF